MKKSMTIKLIVISILIFAVYIGLYNIGADERCLVNALEHRGYSKCNDGIYRNCEIRETGSGLVRITRSFDINSNHGESKVETLFRRLDNKLVPESEVIELGYWDYDNRHFEPIDWGR
jgi:hypothetical protein